MFEGGDCWVCDAKPLQTFNCLLSRFFRCLGRLLGVRLCCGFVLVVQSIEVNGEGCFDDCGQASFQGLLREKTSCNSILGHSLVVRFGCCECTLARWSRDVSRSLAPRTGLR